MLSITPQPTTPGSPCQAGSPPMHALSLTEPEITSWLRLSTTPGISRGQALRLLAAFGLPQSIFSAPPKALCAAAGPAGAAAILRAAPSELPSRVAATRAWLAQPECHLLTLADPAYPANLRHIPDPPPVLYVRGRLQWLHVPAFAIVGSRHASAQGLANAHAFASVLARAGFVIVSGMALGIDGAAHKGTLAVGGASIAVLGTGADRIYPPRHAELARRLAEQGALISEWPLGTPPRPHHFPQRNRLIAGLVRGVLVVEAAARSGSLITARLANEMGRNVYAIPGSIHSALTKGCHALIKEGAKLVESVEDVLEDLAWPIHQSQPAALLTPPPAALEFTGDAKAVLEALGADPAVPDILAARTGLNAARLQAALLALELAERITLLPCGRVAPQNQASSK